MRDADQYPTDLHAVEAAWREALADEDSHSADYRVIHPDGTIRQLHSTGRVLTRDAGQPGLVRGITLEIADRPPPPA